VERLAAYESGRLIVIDEADAIKITGGHLAWLLTDLKVYTLSFLLFYHSDYPFLNRIITPRDMMKSLWMLGQSAPEVLVGNVVQVGVRFPQPLFGHRNAPLGELADCVDDCLVPAAQTQ
jgi:hypothetical protein